MPIPSRRWLPRSSAAVAAGGVLALAGLATAPTALARSTPGPDVGVATAITPTGRHLHPQGRLTVLGGFPSGGALTPDGRFYWAVDSAEGPDDVRVTDVRTGRVTQVLPLPGGYGGVAFSPDGSHAYVAGESLGPEVAARPGDRGTSGDVIHAYRVTASGHATELSPLALPVTVGGHGRTLSLEPTLKAWPGRLTVTPDGMTLAVTLVQADRLALVSLRTGASTTVAVGAYPHDVAASDGLLWVSNELDGTLSVVDPAAARVVATVSGLGATGGDAQSHPEGMTADPRRHRLYVAMANRDRVAVVDTRLRAVLGTVFVGRPEAPGTEPVALAVSPDGARLYAADAGEDAVAVIGLGPVPGTGPAGSAAGRAGPTAAPRTPLGNLAATGAVPSVTAGGLLVTVAAVLLRRRLRRTASPRPRRGRPGGAVLVVVVLIVAAAAGGSAPPARAAADGAVPTLAPALGRLLGRVPTAAYPTDVAVTPDGRRLVWLSGKGLGSDVTHTADGRTTQTAETLIGRLGVLPVPGPSLLATDTRLADATVDDTGPTGAAGFPLVGPGGTPSTAITHVFYVVRENRSYDQVFGTDRRADGDPRREVFDDNGVAGPTGGVTPNVHALTRLFPLFDRAFSTSEVSADGHLVTTGAQAIDYVQRALQGRESGRGKGYDFGLFPISFGPRDFLFDAAAAHGVSMRIYGEGSGGTTPFAADGRPTYAAVAAAADPAYPTDALIGCPAASASGGVCTRDSSLRDVPETSTTRTRAVVSRVDLWRTEFAAQVATDTVPALTYLTLVNDHTNGTTLGSRTPRALVADNDLALGEVVDTVSHSAVWAHSLVVSVEDDSSEGRDHVDAHRMPIVLAGPYVRQHAVLHTRYDTDSVLRTLELILGLPPLSLLDAHAPPLTDAFTVTPDVAGTRYRAVLPEQPLTAVNGPGPAARRAVGLPTQRTDAVPQATLDDLIWRSVFGPGSTPPPIGPNAG